MANSDLRGAVRGRVLLPGEDGFDQAAQAWNRAVEQPVAAVVEAADADDVAALVGYARRSGLSVTAQPSGHGASGDVDGVILLRTARLDEVEVRPGERLARVGAGVKWGAVQAAAGAYGLTGLAGSSPVVSVVGYTLGGGLSWFSRKYGWASEGVRAFDVVDADGVQARVTAASDAELFWALRGGGGDFALVTAIEFDLYPAPGLYGGRVMWPGSRAGEVLEAFHEITAEAPPELSVWLSRFEIPGAPPMVAMDAAYLGDADQGATLLRRLDKVEGPIADTRGVVAVADLGGIADEPTGPVHGLSRAELLTGLDEDAARVLLTDPIDPLFALQIRHLGGALTGPGAGAAPVLAESYALYLHGGAAGPEPARAARAEQDRIVRALGAQASGRKPFTSLAPGETAATAFPERTLTRLRDLKRARDPRNVFRANYPVHGGLG
ncbi:MAG TPA: FAD-binding oxidoreductase [Streptosporangiaceae bacterium]